MKQGCQSGETLDGKYRVDWRLGQGGMGEVYRATHLGTKRAVAVKVIHPQFSNNEEFVERFRREAEAAGRLRHPNVVDVTDFGFAQVGAGRVAYLVMEYLDGCALGDILSEESRLPLEWVVDILEQTCSAVDEAHRQGIVHRDLKPDNIWLEPNRRGGYTVKVLDFGLVKLDPLELSAAQEVAPWRAATASAATPANPETDESPTLIHPLSSEEAATRIGNPAEPVSPRSLSASGAPNPAAIAGAGTGAGRATDAGMAHDTAGANRLTRVGSLMGTPLYMSPEQCRGEPIDTRSDIYSLGVIAYRMLCGETPFAGGVDELIRLHASGMPPPVREKNRKIPRKVARLVMSALAKDPGERPASAAGFASALRSGAEGSGALLRQAVSLYSERFPTFLRISLLAHIPLVAVVAFLELSDKVVPWERLPPTAVALVGLLIVLSMVAANLLSYSTTAALTAPVVIQLMIAPLRPVRIRTALATLRRRLVVFGATSTVVEGFVLFGVALFVLPGIAAALRYALYAPVAVVERLGVWATLRRAGVLMKRSWSTVIVITLLQYMLPVLVWVASTDHSLTFRMDENYSPKEFSFHLGFADHSPLYQLLNIFVTPLAAIMTALLYLKTRQAGGESLRGAIEQFDELEIPRSKWQARMRSRSALRPPTIDDREAVSNKR